MYIDSSATFNGARLYQMTTTVTSRMSTQMATPNANQIKHALRQQGHTLKSWSEANGFKYRDVSEVIRGIRRGNYGTGRDIRLKLGLPVDEQLAA
jgi:gp16 family phage-associated protein